MYRRRPVVWLAAIIVGLAYLAACVFVITLPCRDGLLIGFCSIGKIVTVGASVVLVAAYLILLASAASRRANGLRDQRGTEEKTLALVTMAFVVIPLVFVFILLRNDAALQPHEIQALRLNGQKGIEFVSFEDMPLDPSESGRVEGFIATGVIRVKVAGRYTIRPMRLVGSVPARLLAAGGVLQAEPVTVSMQAGETHRFDYFVQLLPNELITDCTTGSYKVLWQVESLEMFPLYLLGKGIFAQVYPDNSGEFAFVTHVNPDFQTRSYTICSPGSVQ